MIFLYGHQTYGSRKHPYPTHPRGKGEANRFKPKTLLGWEVCVIIARVACNWMACIVRQNGYNII